MLKIPARALLDFTPAELYDILTGEFILVMEDGEIQTNAVETSFSSWAWVYHREYRNTPLLLKHHIRTILGDGTFYNGADLKLLGNALESAFEANAEGGQALRGKFSQMLYDTVNDIYNDSSYRFEEYVGSMDILDYLQVIDHPEVAAAKASAQPTAAGISELYSVTDRVLLKGEGLENNQLVSAYRAKVVKQGQVMQSVAAKGFGTDTDSYQFRYPIMRGYVEGLRSAYDALVETRSASKALDFSGKNLKDAEYSSRKLQLVEMQLQELHMGDCGSTHYMNWHVRGPHVGADGTKFGGDLGLMLGKFYLDEETNSLREITSKDTHLVGKTVRLRHVSGCIHPHQDGICSTCFGTLSLQVPVGTNIGHLCTVTLMAPKSQTVLSIKHEDASVELAPAQVRREDQKFLRIMRDKQSYYFDPKVPKLPGVKLMIPFDRAPALEDIKRVERVEEFNISRISELMQVCLMWEGRQGPEFSELEVYTEGRRSSMTYALLNHIRKVGWTIDANNNYCISLEGWDANESAFALPLRHYNMADYSREITTMLEATMEDMEKRDKEVSSDSFLGELYDLVNSRLKINLAVLEVIVYGMMVVSAAEEDYRLPKPWTDQGLGVLAQIMSRRSMSATMAYEKHAGAISSPESYIYDKRPDSIFDGALMPNEIYGNKILGEI